MATSVGVDIGATQIKVAVLSGTARKWTLDRLVAIERPRPGAARGGAAPGEGGPVEAAPLTLEQLIAEAAAGTSTNDHLAVSFDGAQSYVRVVEVPAAVRRRLAEVLPFELEAQIPFDIDDVVYDHRPRGGIPNNLPQPVLIAAARIDQVRDRIALVQAALSREPDLVCPGGFALADLAVQLAPFRENGVRAIIDVGYQSTEVIVLDGQEPLFARTLSRGVAGMPQTATHLAREIKQTFSALGVLGGATPQVLYITGGGALIPELAPWLGNALQIPVEILPVSELDGLGAEPRADAQRFARAIGLALACYPRHRALDLRRGPLAYERGYGFLRERIPLLTGLTAAIVVTFVFATWARMRNLSADHAVLEDALGKITGEVLGESTIEPERVAELLGKKAGGEDDPMPRADAMDVLVQLSQLIPTEQMKHDVERLEVQRPTSAGSKVILQGIAPTATDVSTIETALKTFRCFQNPTVVKKSKAISDDRQKYTLEVELHCPEEGGGAQKPKAPSADGARSAGK